MRMHKDFRLFMVLILFAMIAITGCSHKIATPDDTKYIKDFHDKYCVQKSNALKEGNLALYVDYSTCIALGQSSPFYQALVPSFVDATKSYYSIKGNQISKENGDVYQLLKSVNEVNYADIKKALETMANGDSESVLITDGEYYDQTIAGGNVNNPYMTEALKIWLKKGHDIYIFSEPYVEPNHGKQYNKKRFYLFFTDSRLQGNIYDRICQTVPLDKFPQVEIFHLSTDHPAIYGDSQHFDVNRNLLAKVEGYGSFEVQDWEIDWKSITSLIVNGVDEKTGEQLKNGGIVMGGIKVDRNSFGGFKIKNIEIRVFDINQEYAEYYFAKEGGTLNNIPDKIKLEEQPNFLIINSEEFKNHGNIEINFDKQMFNPTLLNGKPYNYFRIEIHVSEVENIFDRYSSMFEFDDISKNGAKNISVSESVKQCLADKEIQDMMRDCSIYSVYVKSEMYK